jgi:hypothetical protein
MLNPWVLLGTLAAWASTLVGVWVYRGHMDDFQLKATVEEIAQKSEAAVIKAQNDAAVQTKAMQTKQQEVVNALQTQLSRNATALANERVASSRLRDTVAAYTGGGANGGTAALSVQTLRERLSVLAKLYTEALGDGAEASVAADDANAKRDSCERWSLIVRAE